MALTLMGALMKVPELGGRVMSGNAPVGTAAPTAIYALVSVQPGGSLFTVYSQDDNDVLPDTVNRDYSAVTLYDAKRSGDKGSGDVTQRLYAVMQKVVAAAKDVDTDHDGVTPLRDPLRLRWTPRPMPDEKVADGQYMTASFITNTVR